MCHLHIYRYFGTQSLGNSAPRWITIALLCLFLIICVYPSVGQTFKYPNGRVAIEADSKSEDEIDLDVTGKLKFETKRKKGAKAIVEVAASVYNREIVPDDVYIDYKLTDRAKLTLGYSKKILGLEYELGKKHRLSVHRSPIYQKMESLGIVGRQINLRFLLKPQKNRQKDGAYFSGAIGGDSSHDYNLQFSVQKKQAPWGYGLWVLIETHRIDNSFVPMLAESLAFWYQDDKRRVAVEIFHGTDVQRTEFEKMFGQARNVQFFGPKLEISQQFSISKNVSVTPLFQP